MKRIINLVGEVYLDVEVGPDCDGGIEVRSIEGMTFMISNKAKGKGGTVSGDLLQFRTFYGETPAEKINTDDLLAIIKQENEQEEEAHRRDIAEDRAEILCR